MPPEVCDGPAVQWCEMLPSQQLARGEGRDISGVICGRAHRFFNSESCLLASLCILVAGLGVWEQA